MTNLIPNGFQQKCTLGVFYHSVARCTNLSGRPFVCIRRYSMALILHLYNVQFAVAYSMFGIDGIFSNFFQFGCFFIECLYGAFILCESDTYRVAQKRKPLSNDQKIVLNRVKACK